MSSLLQSNLLLRGLLLLSATCQVLPAAASESARQADHEVLKDPTMPLLNTFAGRQGAGQGEKEDEKQVPLVLQGIVLKSGKRFAVINGQVLSEGKTIEGYEVIRIAQDTVQLQGADEAFTLTLQKVTIKHSNE